MKWIDSKDFDAWASRRDCQEVLPLLIKRLIKATTRNISLISFPAGDNIVYPGWDGRLISKEKTEFIPIGLSLWEIGTNEDIRRKANDDYEKRKINHSEYNPSETVFIFVTPRIWAQKEKWVNEKNNEKFWREVRAYDGRDLEEWLENAPAVGAWLAKHIGKYPNYAEALDNWYNEWSNVTRPPIIPELVLGDREKERKKITDWLSSDPSLPLSVQAFTKDEAIAFLYGVISELSDSEKDYFLSRCLIVNDKSSFKHIITTCKNGLLLIPNFEEIETTLSYSRDHHIYIPLDPDNTTSKDKLVLPFIKKEAFINALTKMGITKEDAEKYSRNTARILSVLRRQLSPVSLQPEWAKPDNVRQLLPALLVGKWNENKEGDKEIVGKISKLPYNEYIASLKKWFFQPDTPIIEIGGFWRLVSHLDVFFAISPYLTNDDFNNFKNVAIQVLKEIDPSLEVEAGERWKASLYGKIPRYSKDLRKGIAETLILIAVFGDKVNSGKGLGLTISAQRWIDNLIYELLNNANGKIWCSLSDVLPLIAEASPLSFLKCVENSLSQNPPSIMKMFSEAEDITSLSTHPSLLWALECLAWDPNLLGKVTLVLGKLAKLDPGGKLANRPINSLRHIFLLWLPQTFATLKQRLECLDLLVKREPDIGWRLIIDLLSRPYDVGSFNYKPLWRVFSDKFENKPTINEYLEGISKIIAMICDNIGNDGMKWFKVMEHFSNLPLQHRRELMNKLSECISLIEEGRLELCNKLREILSRHRSFSDAEWALPEKELQELENLYKQLEPDDIIKRFLWLFNDYRPELPEGKELEDHEKFEHIVNQKRKDAMQSIFDSLKIDGIIKLAIQAKNPLLVGITLAEVCLTDNEENTLFSFLDNDEKNKVSFVQAYIFKKSLTEGNRYIGKLINDAKNKNWSSKKIINLFLGLPQKRSVWDLLKNFDTSIQQEYWKKLNPQFFELTKEDKIYGLEQLMGVKRYFTALDVAAMFGKEVPPKFIAELLLKAVTEKGLDSINSIHHLWDITQLFKILDQSKEIERDEIARLEWLYLPILARPGSDRPPKALHQELADNPEFFTKLIYYIYKSKSEELEEEEEQLSEELKKQRAHLAWELLHSWKTIPGSDDTGKIDYQKLKEWAITARNLCAERGILEVCDTYIGQVFAWAEPDQNGTWPPEEICKIMEEIESEDLHYGFIVEIHNKRGVFTKSLFEGGEQERMLAKQYRAYSEKFITTYPKVSAILREIAENYEIEAKHEDERSKKEDLEW